MQRRTFGAGAAAVVLGLLAPLAGCGAGAGSDSGTLRVVAAEYGGDEATGSRPFWDRVAKEFQAANPGTAVEVQLVPWADVDREVSRMVKAGKAPDIALMGSYSDFAADGLLYSADELLPVSSEANFLAPLAEAGSIGNTLYGLPWVASSRLLFYNEALFRQAGLTTASGAPAAPRTWSELRNAAKALKGKGVKFPYAMPLGPEEAHAEAMIWELSNGGGYSDSAGNYSLASDRNIETFRWIQENLVGPGLTGPVAPAGLDRADAFAAFLRGEVGMLNGYPSLAHQARARGIGVGTVAMPVSDSLASGETPPTMGVADWIMAFRQNGKRAVIGRFLEFLYQDRNLSEFAGRYHLLPSTVSATRTPAGAIDDTDQQFLTALRGAQLYPVNDPAWVEVSDTIKRNIGRAVEPGRDPKSVLEEIAAKTYRARKDN
ncbi:extracellular solute-binding protein [Streptomyces globosus]|uniref:extracellular solute-binding protein n=1 Tax=Streptomyces globosus TaxID=68209 RepID=UPI00382BD585